MAAVLAKHGLAGHAVTTAGSASTIVIPVVAATGTYTSEISVFYPGPFSGSTTSIVINVFYFEAQGLPSPGPKPCTPITVAAGQVTSFQLATQCTLGAGSHFGLLGLQDASAQKLNTFYAFNRTQSITTQQGFSIEGFPIGNFSAQNAHASGLKRVAAAPGFATNCFVGSLVYAYDYSIEVHTSDGSLLGTAITGHLDPFQLIRYLDIFSAAGAPAGDYTNARVKFSVNDANGPALIGFCTVQDDVYFGADFRIAKSRDALDNGQRRAGCLGGNSDCTDVGASPFQITDVTAKQSFRLLIRPPDFVQCTILGSQAAMLELALLPGGSFNPGGTVLAGGSGQQSFYYDTGGRGSATNGGFAQFFNLEIETIASAPPGTYSYGIRCDSGNGTGDSGRVNSGVVRGF